MTRSSSGTGRIAMDLCKLHFSFRCSSHFSFTWTTVSFRLSHSHSQFCRLQQCIRWAKKKLLHSKLIIVNLRMYTPSLVASSRSKKRDAHHQLPVRVQCEKKEKVYCITRRRIVQGEEFNWANFFHVSASRQKRKTFFSRSWSITWELT